MVDGVLVRAWAVHFGTRHARLLEVLHLEAVAAAIVAKMVIENSTGPSAFVTSMRQSSRSQKLAA